MHRLMLARNENYSLLAAPTQVRFIRKSSKVLGKSPEIKHRGNKWHKTMGKVERADEYYE